MSDRKRYAAAGIALVLMLAAAVPFLLPEQPTVYHGVHSSREEETGARLPAGEIDPNTDDAAVLAKLPRIGEVLAQAIIAERLANGNYHYPEDLTAVKGIGLKTVDAFRAMLNFGEE